jgi:hypothetical protein
MAKKVVATLQTGKTKAYTKVIRAVKNPKTGMYSYKESIVLTDEVNDFLKNEK